MNKKTIKIVFRLDDPSAISPIMIEKKLIDILIKNQVTFTFGVIPFVTLGNFREPEPCDNSLLQQDKIQLFKYGIENNALEVALHGYEHKTIDTIGNDHSEFRGADLDSQINKIKEGKALLEQQLGTAINTFIPPWNTYDENTLKALMLNNITCISSNRFQPARRISDMNYLPITIELPDLKSAVNMAIDNNDSDSAIIVLMHPYDFKESGDERAKYNCQYVDTLLQWIKNQQHLEVCSVSQLVMRTNSCDYYRYKWNKSSILENIYPPGLILTEDTPVYYSTTTAKNKRIKNTIITIGFMILIVSLGILSTFVIFSIFSDLNKYIYNGLLYSFVLIILLLAVKAFKQRTYYFRTFSLSNLILGAIIGLSLI